MNVNSIIWKIRVSMWWTHQRQLLWWARSQALNDLQFKSAGKYHQFSSSSIRNLNCIEVQLQNQELLVQEVPASHQSTEERTVSFKMKNRCLHNVTIPSILGTGSRCCPPQPGARGRRSEARSKTKGLMPPHYGHAKTVLIYSSL